MSRKSSIDSLPDQVRKELLEQYHQYPGWTINDHTDWLAEKGYAISRSALHRYLTSKTEEPAPPAHRLHSEQVRMRCLEVASSIYKGSDLEGLKAVAESLLEWVEDPK